ncbi:cytochrome c [Shewanella cyperi]|uniref:C-type cytochrome n=1 Tax=Shewanella cyperi TaxID=2814292 RepID=A0A974XL94_9GAMM|nr:c-type cytochrome [Shewanella cyperi]QSX30515.1 c-type cytochrome [Shewanella cyperi]QSX41294.1 c-type cytochrome [Shewanella cyperi]
MFSVLLFSFTVVGQAADTPSQQNANGAILWRNNCAQCHGADGRGVAAMREAGHFIDFTSIAAEVSMDRPRMLIAVRDGKPGTAMMGFRDKLSYEEIIAVVDYARESFMAKQDNFAQYDEGKKLFERHCSVCHGDRGEGAIMAQAGLFPKPAVFTDPAMKKVLDRNRMIFSITNGRPQTAMTSWGKRLGEHKINAIVDYIRVVIMDVPRIDGYLGRPLGEGADSSDPFLSGADVQGTTASQVQTASQTTQQDKGVDPFLDNQGYDPSKDLNIKDDSIIFGEAIHDHGAHMGAKLDINAPLPVKLTADRAAGKELYNKTCITCHGEHGDGQGPRAFFIFPKPRDFTHPAATESFSRAHIYERIRMGVLGSEMPAWGQVLTKQQMADLTEYVFSEFIAPRNPKVKNTQVTNEQ